MDTLKKYKTNLYRSYGVEMPSFFNGVSKVFTLFPVEFSRPQKSEEIDKETLLNDWKIIGDDIRKAMETYEQERSSVTEQK